MTPPLVDGQALEYIRCTLHNGDTIEGVKQLIDETHIRMWVNGEPFVTEISHSSVRMIEKLLSDEDPPNSIAKVIQTKTGGIGLHIRKQVIFHKGEDNGSATLLVSVPEDSTEKFENLISKISYINISTDKSYFELQTFGRMCSLTLSQRKMMQKTIAILGWNEFTSYPANKSEYRIVSYFPDKMSRALHMWVHQCQENIQEAGPVRDPWRWRMNHLPEHWNCVYTLGGVARETVLDLVGRNENNDLPDVEKIYDMMNKISQPLKYHVYQEFHNILKEHVDRIDKILRETRSEIDNVSLEECEFKEKLPVLSQQLEQYCRQASMASVTKNAEEFEIVSRKALDLEDYISNTEARLRIRSIELIQQKRQHEERFQMITDMYENCSLDNESIIPHLSFAQMNQLENLVYCLDYAPFDRERKQRIKHVLRVFGYHGWIGRLSGQYIRSGKFRGYGDTLRQYTGENSLPVDAMNRLKDGKLGLGGRGYKGRHKAKPEKKVYQPKWRMARTEAIDKRTRKDVDDLPFISQAQ